MMATSDRQNLQLRAQEIINASPDGMTVPQALAKAALERYGNNPKMLAEAFGVVAASSMTGLRKRTYELPDDDGALFQIPSIIGIRTDDGDLLVPRERASLGHARKWVKEGRQHHATQHLRFKRADTELEPLKEESDDLPWWSARHMITSAEDSDDAEE